MDKKEDCRMGLFKLFLRMTYPPAQVAANACKQYHKAKYYTFADSPEEIPYALWTVRYSRIRLDAEGKRRMMQYAMSEFPIQTMIDFYLSSFDIEFLSAPEEIKTYGYCADYIGKALVANGVPSTRDDTSQFIEKWIQLIRPLRSG
jgi:hypothetical protein